MNRSDSLLGSTPERQTWVELSVRALRVSPSLSPGNESGGCGWPSASVEPPHRSGRRYGDNRLDDIEIDIVDELDFKPGLFDVGHGIAIHLGADRLPERRHDIKH